MKILIVKLGSIGDVIHTLPVLPAIKKSLPDAEISWVVEKKSAEILQGNPFLSQLFEVDTKSLRRRKTFGKSLLDANRQRQKLRAANFDVALDFQGLLKSALIAKTARSKKLFGFSRDALREPASRFLLNETVDVDPGVHVIVKNLTLVKKALKIQVPTANFEFPIFTEESHKQEAEKILAQTGGHFAILNPAGGWITKLWNAENFGRLADKLWEENGLASVVATAHGEKNLAEKVLKASKSGKIILTTPSLKGFYELAKRAAVYVGGDTGPTHLAVAAGVPTVGIFGPTEWWYNGSPNPQDICVERFDISCRVDCHRRTCDKWICLDIPVETVFKAVQKRLAKKPMPENQKIDLEFSIF